jgi:hypothetical protein
MEQAKSRTRSARAAEMCQRLIVVNSWILDSCAPVILRDWMAKLGYLNRRAPLVVPFNTLWPQVQDAERARG